MKVISINDIKQIIKKNGGIITVNTFGGHADKDLGKLTIIFGEQHFNAWFNIRTNYFHSPYYHFGYRGNITNMTIEEGLNKIIKLVS